MSCEEEPLCLHRVTREEEEDDVCESRDPCVYHVTLLMYHVTLVIVSCDA